MSDKKYVCYFTIYFIYSLIFMLKGKTKLKELFISFDFIIYKNQKKLTQQEKDAKSIQLINYIIILIK